MWLPARGQDVGKPRPGETVAAVIARRALAGQPDLPGGDHFGCQLAAMPPRCVTGFGVCDSPIPGTIDRLLGDAAWPTGTGQRGAVSFASTRPDPAIGADSSVG